MAKITKTQKRNLALSMQSKLLKLFREGLVTAKDVENMRQLTTRIMKKL